MYEKHILPVPEAGNLFPSSQTSSSDASEQVLVEPHLKVSGGGGGEVCNY